MANESMLDLLRGMKLCANLPEADLTTFAVLWQRRSVRGGTVIITEDQPGEVVYLVVEGSVKISVSDGKGKETIVGFRGAGEILGEVSLIDGLSRSATVITQEPTVILFALRDPLRDMLHEMPILIFNLARLMTRRLRLATAQIQALGTLDVKGRVARQLLALAEDYGSGNRALPVVIPLHLPQVDLANMVGASRASVNEVLVGWKTHGYITIDQNQHITVLDLEALEKLIQ